MYHAAKKRIPLHIFTYAESSSYLPPSKYRITPENERTNNEQAHEKAEILQKPSLLPSKYPNLWKEYEIISETKEFMLCFSPFHSRT